MAQAYPDFGAGDGDVLSQHGSSSEWLYHVEVDAEGDDPMVPLLAVAWPGHPHPDPQFVGLTVSGYRKAKRLNERWYDIVVLFDSLSDQTYGIWRRGGQFGNETRPLVRSLAHYDDDGNLIDAPLLVGSGKYYIPGGTPQDEPWSGRFKLEDGTKVNQKVEVDPSQGGIEINDGILPLHYEITVPQLTIQKITSIMSMRWSTNDKNFPVTRSGTGAYEQWTLIFSGFAFDDHIINLTGAGPYWFSTVSIEILYKPIHNFLNPYGWRGTRRYDWYSDDTRARQAVYDYQSGEAVAVARNYVTYQEFNFYNLFMTIGGSVPHF